jgi:hypothetical protein
MLTAPDNSRSLHRRRVYLGEGLTLQIEPRDAWLEAEAIDLTHEGLGVAVLLATDVMMPAVGEVVAVRCFAAASCPWVFGETLHLRIVQVGAGGMTQPYPPLPPRAELDFDLHLASIAHRSTRCWPSRA